MGAPVIITRWWRHGLLLLLVGGSLALLLAACPPIGQNPNYHHFADRRAFFGVPNFLDVITNLPFLAVGAAGFWIGVRGRYAGASVAWTIFFLGVALVGLGSAWYHWEPNNATLVWDRLPMTIGFMALLVALLSECISPKLERYLLRPALLAGLLSVAYWKWSGDLRLYAWVQFMPLLAVSVALSLFRSRYSHSWILPVALGCYVLAKVAEHNDHGIYVVTGQRVGGHALKHLVAALGCFLLWEMLRRRRLNVD